VRVILGIFRDSVNSKMARIFLYSMDEVLFLNRSLWNWESVLVIEIARMLFELGI